MPFSSKSLTLEEIKQVVESIGNLVESTLNTHSLGLVIGNSGETTFTRSGCKLLLEAGFTSPVAKVIINCAKNYTANCGEDCKYLLFILKEVIGILHAKIHGNDEMYMRVKFIHEISSMKQMLPCIFNSIRNIPITHVASPKSCLFSKDLYSIVLTFMMSKFSASVAEHLSSLICNFIHSIKYESSSLKFILSYVISHFDLFCFKILASLKESQVLSGFIFFRKCISSNTILENTRFIIVQDMSMKNFSNNVTWKISDESFVYGLNQWDLYQKVFSYFKVQGIKLIITSCAADKNLKLLCGKNCIILLDRIEKEEIEHILCCVKLFPLENLNEALESKHFGELKYLKPFSCSNSYFLNILCSNSPRLLNAHNILLSAPFDALWKEYYAECLNCLKLVNKWLCSNTTADVLTESVIKGCLDKPIHHLSSINCICTQLEMSYNKILKLNENTNSVLESHQVSGTSLQNHNSVVKPSQYADITLHIPNSDLKSHQNNKIAPQITNSVLEPHHDIDITLAITEPILQPHQDICIALPPGLWEFFFQYFLKKISSNLSLPCRNITQILHFIIVKLTCEKIGIQFSKVVDLQDAYCDFSERSKKSNKSHLEPILCKEIMIYSVLDLVLQLLKVDKIVIAK